MSVKLFVGGLAWKTRSEGLREAFSSFGAIEDAIVIMERDSDRSRGFGFVTFASEEAANAAISAMDGSELDGRRLRVNKTEDRPQRRNNRRERNERPRNHDRSRNHNDRGPRSERNYNDRPRRPRDEGSEGGNRRDNFRSRDRRTPTPVVDEINIPDSVSEDATSAEGAVQDFENRSKWGKTARKNWGNKNKRRRDFDGEDSDERRKKRKPREEDDWNDW